ncbi:NTP transferase domain-containing protein [Paenibacillus sp. N4]|uniref:nucleotidyltransferase family protein n=1 Tax=Paenibacillus vietnamensis TaxID=2590547 RepID=UPI0021E40DEA|nr:NTP transferase domain-containing protein [Paenibacillus vietnamensis]MCA0754166.1 NTP transferase domain-containing protein [Paenibacillus vietnamensis]
MGFRKQLLELEKGQPLAGMALHALLTSRLKEIVVVVRPEDDLQWLQHSLGQYKSTAGSGEWPDVHVAVCSRSPEGMSHSIRSGLLHLLSFRPQLEEVMVTLADQPFLSAALINRLTDYWASQPGIDYAAAALKVDGSSEPLLMPPAILGSTMFVELLRLEGDEGARKLFKMSRFKGGAVEPFSRMCLFDVDTPEDADLAKIHYRLMGRGVR